MPSLALSAALVTVGCATPQISPVATTTPGGAINYFDQVNGLAAVDIRVIDKRMGTQAYADVADFHTVKFEIRNPEKLKTSRQSPDLSASSTGVYSQAFTRLPSDKAENYELTAGLYASPYQLGSIGSELIKVGEGVSPKFSLEPGQRKTITVLINAVGEFEFDSAEVLVATGLITPTFVAGDQTTKALIKLDKAKNPLAKSLTYRISRIENGVDGEDVTPQSPTTIDVDHWDSPNPTQVPFVLPALLDAGEWEAFRLHLEMRDAKGELLSTRARLFRVEPGAELDVNIDPADLVVSSLGDGTFKINDEPYTLGQNYLFNTMGGTEITITNTSLVELDIKNVYDGYSYDSIGNLAPGETKAYTELKLTDGKVYLRVEEVYEMWP